MKDWLSYIAVAGSGGDESVTKCVTDVSLPPRCVDVYYQCLPCAGLLSTAAQPSYLGQTELDRNSHNTAITLINILSALFFT